MNTIIANIKIFIRKLIIRIKFNRPIGTIILYKNQLCKIEKHSTCDDCIFKFEDCIAYKIPCVPNLRNDNYCVEFVKIK